MRKALALVAFVLAIAVGWMAGLSQSDAQTTPRYRLGDVTINENGSLTVEVVDENNTLVGTERLPRTFQPVETPASTLPSTTTSSPSTTQPTTTTTVPAAVPAALTVNQALTAAHEAGFTSEDQLLTMVSIGIAESALRTRARNWHPEYGYRPAADEIGVEGPASVWNADQTRQLNSDRGIWQISSYWWPEYTDAQTDNPASAAVAAWEISDSGTDFSPWDSWKYGNAQAHLDRAVNGWPALRPLVRAFLENR